MPVLKVKKLDPAAKLPLFATEGSVCMDVRAAEHYLLYPCRPIVVQTGLAFEVPPGFELLIRPRSGLASKGVTILNTPGTLDSDYRGECLVIMVYILPSGYFEIQKGDRIAQIAIREVPTVTIKEVEELSETTRGANGFGSTGVK